MYRTAMMTKAHWNTQKSFCLMVLHIRLMTRDVGEKASNCWQPVLLLILMTRQNKMLGDNHPKKDLIHFGNSMNDIEI